MRPSPALRSRVCTRLRSALRAGVTLCCSKSCRVFSVALWNRCIVLRSVRPDSILRRSAFRRRRVDADRHGKRQHLLLSRRGVLQRAHLGCRFGRGERECEQSHRYLSQPGISSSWQSPASFVPAVLLQSPAFYRQAYALCMRSAVGCVRSARRR